jgi:SAM-dependent methyltransferase
MKSLSIDRVKAIAAATSTWRGWDLLGVKTRRAPVPWQLTEVIAEYLSGLEVILDMGCGNGKLLAQLANGFTRGIGVDISKERIDEARLSLPIMLRTRIHFTRASSHKVPAPDAAFQVVLNRQAPLFPAEIDRLLAPGGYFITQQVGPENTRAIIAAFNEARWPLPPWPDEMLLPNTFTTLDTLGYRTLRSDEYDVPYVFADAESLIYWLQMVPVPQDFNIESDAETVLEILDRLTTPNGIVTNEHRQLLVMQKPT